MKFVVWKREESVGSPADYDIVRNWLLPILEKAGNALKVVSMRLRGMKGDLEELGEDVDDNVTNLSKMQGQVLNLTHGKVNIFDDVGNFKSTYDILQGIADVWKELNSVEQADLLETIAGKHRANDVAAIIGNWQNVEKAAKSAAEAEGSAMEEQAKYADSIQGRVNSLTAMWQEFSNTVLSSNAVKGFVSVLTEVLKVIEQIIDAIGGLGTLSIAGGLFGIGKMMGIGKIASEVLKSGNAFNTLGDAASAASQKVGGAWKELKGNPLKSFATGATVAVAALSVFMGWYDSMQKKIEETRQENIDLSNSFNESFSGFEQAYIKYSGKTLLTAEEESELASAIDGTITALGDKSGALRDAAGASSEYAANLEKIAKVESEQSRTLSMQAMSDAKARFDDNTIGDNAGQLSWTNSFGNVLYNLPIVEAVRGWMTGTSFTKYSNADFALGDKADKAYKAVEKYIDKGRELGYIAKDLSDMTGMLGTDDEGFVFDHFDSDFDNYINQVKYVQGLVDELNTAAAESGDKSLLDSDLYKNAKDSLSQLQPNMEEYIAQTYNAEKANYQLNNGIAKNVDEFNKMRDAVLKSSSDSIEGRSAIGSLMNTEYQNTFDLSSLESQMSYIKSVTDGIADISSTDMGKFETVLDLKTNVNGSSGTVGDYVDTIESANDAISKIADENAQEFLRVQLGIEVDDAGNIDDEIIHMKDKVIDAMKKSGIDEEVADEFTDSLTAAELNAVVEGQIEVDWDNFNAEEVRKQIADHVKMNEAISFEVDIEAQVENLDNINSAISKSVSGKGLDTEAYENIERIFANVNGYDPSKLFERTANGIRLNTDELRSLNGEMERENVAGLENKMSALGDQYNKVRSELSDLAYGTDEYNQKLGELNGIEAQIQSTEALMAQYEGLTSAYNEWQMAESAGNQRDMYESVINGFKTVEDELSRGWVDEGTIQFVEMLSGKGLTSGNVDEIRSAWEGLGKTIEHTTYSAKDFFTVNKDGQSTSDGVYNFLDAVGQLEEEAFGGKDVVQRDGNGNIIGFDFQLVGGDEAIAEALGVSEELVDIMVRASDDAGFVVSMDGTFQQFDILKAKAQEAATSLNETLGRLGKEGFNFDFNADSVEEIQPQLEKAQEIWNEFKQNKNEDGTINMDVQGAEEAFTVVSTLQTMLDKASEPVYMNIQASQVEKELQKPLGELQEYERLTQTEHQLNIKGADTTELKKSKEEILDYFDELQESNPELAAQLKIEDLSREELQKKLENGELEIPATVDLQLEMNDNLAILADKALLDAGVIDEEEFQKRVDVRLDANVDGSDVNEKVDKAIADAGIDGEQKDVMVKFLTDTSDIDSYTPEQLDTIVKYTKDVTDIDSYTPADKKAVCDFVVNNEEVMSYTPEDKAALAKYMADPSQLDSFTPEDKNAVARFTAEHGEVDAWNPSDRQAIAKYLLDSAQADGYQPSDKGATVVYGKNSSAPDGYQPDPKGADVIYNPDTSQLPTWFEPITRTVKYIASGVGDCVSGISGGGKVNGTAHVNGAAFADGSNHKKFKSGNWGTEDSGTALMGELGQETIVRDGHFFTVGDNGAEFVKYRKGDIIFNHRQTEELFKNGYVTSGGGRGKAYVDGTAFARGSSGSGGWGRPGAGSYNYNVSSGNSKSTKSSKSSKSSDSKASEEAEKFEEVLDWIAIAIDRIEREIKNLDTVASSTFRGWSERTSALNKQIAQTRNEIDLQQRAYDRYMKAANDVGLDAGWAQKVRDGKVDVELITDENVADKVKQYQEWYEKALDARDAVIELTEAESQLFQQRFDNVSEKFDGYLGVIEHEKNMLDEFISQSEAKGYITSQKYYEALSKNTNDRISELKKQRDEMTAEMNAAVDSGAIEKYSQSWYEMVNAIDDVTLEIESANTELLEFKKTMRELDWEVFELIQDRISGITEESDFLIDLMSNKKLYDDKGQLTDEGQASMGLHGVNYNTYMNQADQYAKKVAELNAQIAKDPYNQDLINKRDEYLEAQRESILNAEDEKNAIRDMVEEGINLELDALDELINKRNDALDSAKNLYDYQKKIAEQTKEIADIEKQLGAYAGDSSEETKATIQELKVQLEDARADLEESEYDQYISDQQKLLDELYLEYETILNMRLDNIDALVQQQIDYINQNAANIQGTITEQAGLVGYQLTEQMKQIWDTTNVNANGDKIKNVIDFYGRDFGSKLTTVNSTINNVVVGVNNMIAKLDAIAQQKANQAASSSASKPKPNNGNANNKPSTHKPSPAPAKPKADAYGIAGSIWVLGGSKSGWGNDPVRSGKLTKAYGVDFARQVQSIINSTFATGRWDRKRDYSPYTSYRLLGYATGKHNIESDRYAWTQEQGSEMIVRPSDGAVLTPLAKGDSVLNASASGNIWDMANNPADFIKSNLGSSANGIPSSSAGSNITQNIENVTFSMPNVKNYDQLIRAMQKDRNFERLVLSMSVDRLAGGSSLAKGKAVK